MSLLDYMVSESLRRMNLERSDIAALKQGECITSKIEDIRYWRDTILALQKETKRETE